VAYYDFEEGSGSTLGDKSGLGIDGTLYNSPTWTTDVPTLSNENSYALELNGTNTYVQLPINSTRGDIHNIQVGDMTVSIWVKPTGTSCTVVGKDGSGTIGRYYISRSADGYGFGIKGTSNVALSGVGGASNEWTHVAGVKNKETIMVLSRREQVHCCIRAHLQLQIPVLVRRFYFL
jgi:hypothetical protein